MNSGLDARSIITYLIAAAILFLVGYILFKIFKLPVAKVSGVIVNTVLGGCVIYLANYVFSYFGFSIGLNPFTAIFTGLMGLPGLVSLVVMRLLI